MLYIVSLLPIQNSNKAIGSEEIFKQQFIFKSLRLNLPATKNNICLKLQTDIFYEFICIPDWFIVILSSTIQQKKMTFHQAGMT